jgi:hypothetical protein
VIWLVWAKLIDTSDVKEEFNAINIKNMFNVVKGLKE